MSRSRGAVPRWAVLLLPALATGCFDFSEERYCSLYPDACTMRVVQVEPPLGFTSGGDVLLIHGFAFEPETQVLVGDVPVATDVQTSYQLSLLTPPHEGPATVDLTVTNRYGQVTLPGAFQYVTSPFKALKQVPATADFPYFALASADFDRDGKPDLAAANAITGALRILRNTGGLQFSRVADVPSPSIEGPISLPAQVIAQDVDRDGNPDLITAYSRGTVAVFFGDGSGTFQPPIITVAAPGSFGPLGIDAGDLDGDGFPDLAVGTETGVNILLGNGDGTFQAPFEVTKGFAVNRIHLQDLNGDQRLDMITTRLTAVDSRTPAQQVFISFGSAEAFFPVTHVVSIGAPAEDAVGGDLNGDGLGDVVVSGGGGTLAVLLGKPGDELADPLPHPFPGMGSRVAVHDFDGDGKADVLVTGLASPSPTAFGLLFGRGAGQLQPPMAVTRGATVLDLLVTDLDQDGKAEVAFVTQELGLSILPGQ